MFGMGRSLGCKLHLLNSCRECADAGGVRAGNVLRAYGNASFGGDFSEWVPVEFEPSPEERGVNRSRLFVGMHVVGEV